MKRKVNMLRDNHIKPGGFYSRSKIEKAIQKKFDTAGFGVKCFWKEGKKELTEIKVCTNRTHVIPCKCFETREWRTCGRGEIWLSIEEKSSWYAHFNPLWLSASNLITKPYLWCSTTIYFKFCFSRFWCNFMVLLRFWIVSAIAYGGCFSKIGADLILSSGIWGYFNIIELNVFVFQATKVTVVVLLSASCFDYFCLDVSPRTIVTCYQGLLIGVIIFCSVRFSSVFT